MGVRLVLEGALTMRVPIDAVPGPTLRGAMEPASAANLSIDCSAATEVDLTFIQLLVATRLSGQLAGQNR